MSQTVWKYSLPCAGVNRLLLPTGAQVLHVASQNDDLCLWVQVDPERSVVWRTFHVVGTGHDLPSDAVLRFVGTAMLFAGSLVLHVFEEAA